MIISLAIVIASYVLRSMGMYSIALRRGIERPWLAWVPVANLYMQGSISDQYQYVVKGKNTSRRKWLVGLYIAVIVVTIIMTIITVLMAIGGAAGAYNGADEGAIVGMVLGSSLGIILMGIAVSALSIAMAVFFYIAEYDLFRSCDPNNSVLYIVLTIFLGVAEPVLVFICRDKDLGMPPRKQNPPVGYIPQQPAYQPQSTPAYQPYNGPAQQVPAMPAPQPAPESVAEVAEQPAEVPTWQPDMAPVEESSWQPAEEIAWEPPADDIFAQPQQEEAEPWNQAESE